MPRRISQAGELNPLDLRVTSEVGGHRLGVGIVSLHPQAQGLQTLQEQERVERADGRANVAQQLHAGFDDV